MSPVLLSHLLTLLEELSELAAFLVQSRCVVKLNSKFFLLQEFDCVQLTAVPGLVQHRLVQGRDLVFRDPCGWGLAEFLLHQNNWMLRLCAALVPGYERGG